MFICLGCPIYFQSIIILTTALLFKKLLNHHFNLFMTSLKICNGRLLRALLACIAIAGLASCASVPAKPADTALREHQLLDAGWLFHRGEVASDE